MEIVKITADVYCSRAQDNKIRYRLYLDNDLLIERQAYWDHNSQIVKELIVVTLPKGKHVLSVQKISKYKSFLILANILINDVKIPIKIDRSKVTYEFEI